MTQKEMAEEVLGEHLESLGIVIQKGFDRYQRTPERHLHSPRSRASLIHDFIVHEAQKVFTGVRGVRWFFRSQLFLISFGYGKVVLRMKKVGEDFRAFNHATLQSSFFETAAQSEMFGDSILLTAGYQPDATFTAIREKVLTCFSAGKVKWKIEIPDVSDNVIEFPTREESTQIEKSRVRRKDSDIQPRVITNEGDGGKS